MTGINYGRRLRLGLLIPSGNVICEPQLQAMLPEGVSLHVTRLPLVGSSRAELLGMAEGIEPAARLLGDACVDLIAFHCTAVSTFAPDMAANIIGRIEAATGIRAIATADALVAAFAFLGVRRLVMVTPYAEAINEREIAFLGHHGIEVLRAEGLGLDTNTEMARVEPAEWQRLVLANRDERTDAYFISCTAIRTAETIEPLEGATGRPVVTSNQAMLWHALRKGGVQDAVGGFGRLLSRPG